MRAAGGGAIVNVTSVASHIAAAGQGAYAGSKHAALGLTKGAALDYADQGIRVTAVSPGLVDTRWRATSSGSPETRPSSNRSRRHIRSDAQQHPRRLRTRFSGCSPTEPDSAPAPRFSSTGAISRIERPRSRKRALRALTGRGGLPPLGGRTE
jgi:NAD(P)-dependent dehydrogenase (short-subunit alcohol dehydrogenase family)